ncbi:Fe-S cluster assembly ATPase SufC [Ilumatobacter sp.]|uniref:Fe-S cluster assembly ATPase SufC n=1 Tax=Ilumatobacter sp. TaxID=1967498 RepID=UPI00375066F4|nr:Fe-S cluster assembly ATPase SufC [Ilumatobacter sp.]
MTAPLFRVDDLHAQPAESPTSSAEDALLRGLNLTVKAGEVHAITGPNGSGASALGATLMGSNQYEVTSGTIEFKGDDITEWPVDERAKAGMFLAFHDPQVIPGVSVIQFLRQAMSTRTGMDLSVPELRLATTDWIERLGIDPAFADRHLNEGFSPVESANNEIIQMAILKPEVAILDATAAGLDIDVLRIAAQGIRNVRTDQPDMGVVLITHDPQLLSEVTPDHIHILVDGHIAASGGMELAAQLEQDGYDAFRLASAVQA